LQVLSDAFFSYKLHIWQNEAKMINYFNGSANNRSNLKFSCTLHRRLA